MYSCMVDTRGATLFLNEDISNLKEETRLYLISHAICTNCKKPFNPNMNCCGSDRHPLFIDKRFQAGIFELLKNERRKIYAEKGRTIRERRKRLTEGIYTKEDIDILFHLLNGKCAYCGAELKDLKQQNNFEIEHVIPLSKGGSEWPDNILLACRNCNLKKATKGLNSIWKYIEERNGREFVKAQKAIVKSLSVPMKKITAKRKNEYLSIYSDAPCLTWIDAIIKSRIRADYINIESDIRDKVICIIETLNSQISEAAIKKSKIRRNKKQDLSSHILKILILAGIHDELETYYEKKKDFQKRFSFDELLEDLNAYYIQIGSHNLPEIAYSEYSQPAHAELFDVIIHSIRELFKSNSQQAFNDTVENVVKLNASYLIYQFPK